MKTINVHEAKTNFSRLLDRAHRGEEIIISKSGKPFARLVPLNDMEERTPGQYPETIPKNFYDELPEEELEAWNL